MTPRSASSAARERASASDPAHRHDASPALGDATTLPALRHVSGLGTDACSTVLDALERAVAHEIEHVHVEPATDGWRVRHRLGDVLVETRPDDRALPDALERLVTCLTADASGTTATNARPGGQLGAFTARIGGETRLVSAHRSVGSGGRSFRLSLHGNAVAPPRLDALGPDGTQLRAVRELLQRPSGWLAVGAADTFAGERLVRALAQELVSPDRRLVCLEPPVHPPLARVLQLVDERELVPCDALDADAVLLAATPSDAALRALAANAAERLLVVQRCRARRPSDVLRRLLAIGLAPAWVALAWGGALMHHRVRLVCHHCRVRTSPEEDGERWLDTLSAPPVRDVGAWLERSLQTRFREGGGCERCLGTGHAGVRDVIDLVGPDDALRRQLLDGEVDAALARIDTLGTLDRRLAALLASGDVSETETARHLPPRRY